MTPRFTAERTLAATSRSYRPPGAVSRPSYAAGAVAPQEMPVSASGVYDGTYCLAGVLSVITVDLDEQGHVVNYHIVDEIGSC